MSMSPGSGIGLAGSERLGEILVNTRCITQDQLRVALVKQDETGKRLGKILVEDGVITESRLVQILSAQLNIDVCDPVTVPIHPDVLKLVSADLASELRVVPLAVSVGGEGQDIIQVATADPTSHATHSRLEQELGMRVQFLLAGDTEIELGLARHYGGAAGPPTVIGVPSAPPPEGAPASVDMPPVDELPPIGDDMPRQGSWADLMPRDSWPAPALEQAPTPAAVLPPPLSFTPEVGAPPVVGDDPELDVEIDLDDTVARAAPEEPVDHEAELRQIVEDTRAALESFANNGEIDASTTSWILRVVVAYLLNEGVIKSDGLEEAVRRVLYGGG